MVSPQAEAIGPPRGCRWVAASPGPFTRRFDNVVEAADVLESHNRQVKASVVGGTARVLERTEAEEGRFRWTVEAPSEAEIVLRLLPGVLAVEPLTDVRGGPGKLAA